MSAENTGEYSSLSELDVNFCCLRHRAKLFSQNCVRTPAGRSDSNEEPVTLSLQILAPSNTVTESKGKLISFCSYSRLRKVGHDP